MSISSQHDVVPAPHATEVRELCEDAGDELAEPTAIYQAKGLSPAPARTVAAE